MLCDICVHRETRSSSSVGHGKKADGFPQEGPSSPLPSTSGLITDSARSAGSSHSTSSKAKGQGHNDRSSRSPHADQSGVAKRRGHMWRDSQPAASSDTDDPQDSDRDRSEEEEEEEEVEGSIREREKAKREQEVTRRGGKGATTSIEESDSATTTDTNAEEQEMDCSEYTAEEGEDEDDSLQEVSRREDQVEKGRVGEEAPSERSSMVPRTRILSASEKHWVSTC